jgi:glycosyltransferase involved in cell wall biosynthesis
MREAVTDGEEGFLVPLRDVDATAERLGELARNAPLRGVMGGRARRRAVAEFDLQDQGRKFLQMYQAVIAHDATCDAGPAHVASGN